MPDLVETIADVVENLETLDRYGHGGREERRFHRGRIKNGKVFVALKKGGRFLFSPSKFAGYAGNDLTTCPSSRSAMAGLPTSAWKN